jgi:hypothetical protein
MNGHQPVYISRSAIGGSCYYRDAPGNASLFDASLIYTVNVFCAFNGAYSMTIKAMIILVFMLVNS